MPEGLGATLLQPAVVLSLLVVTFQTSAYLVIFGRIGWHTLATLGAAIVGAWLADALLGPGSILRLGDYSLLSSSIGAWLGIAAVEGLAWYRDRSRDGEVAAGASPRVDGA